MMIESRNWCFKVSCEVKPGEQVFVVGCCDELGGWNSQKAIALEPEYLRNASDELTEIIWKAVVRLPATEVQYRYCLSACMKNVEHNRMDFAVLRWETNLLPRVIAANKSNIHDPSVDLFGCNGETEKIDQGWLVTDSLIQLKLFKSDIYNEAIVLWNRKLKDKKVLVKVTAIDMNKNLNRSSVEHITDESTEVELTQLRMQSKVSWPHVQVAIMKEGLSEFQSQDQFGVECLMDDMIIFQCRAFVPSTISFLLDYYIDESCGDIPKYIGCSHILPSSLKENFGLVNQPITSKKQVPIGHLTVHYLIVHPLKEYQCDMQVSYARYWKACWTGLEVGHRGAGNSFHSQTTSCANIRENTIASLKFAAENGADMVEFDVQLSKDLTPVLYHDFYAVIALQRKRDGSNEHLLELPIKDLSLDQLQALKVYHRTEKGADKFSDEEFEDHQPFSTLQKAMQVVPDSCGFNIEVKWTMRRKDGTYELEHAFELNRYIDIILQVVLKSCTRRKIIFSCFHPDICTMIRLKQNRYPVLFLTNGELSKGMPYEDVRTRSVQQAVHYATSSNILGINVESENFLKNSQQVQLALDQKQIVFCWGDANNDKNTIKFLKKLGLHGIIYDKIDVYNTKAKKESIFLCEDPTAQTCILASHTKKTAQNGTSSAKPVTPPNSDEEQKHSPTSFTGLLEGVCS